MLCLQHSILSDDEIVNQVLVVCGTEVTYPGDAKWLINYVSNELELQLF